MPETKDGTFLWKGCGRYCLFLRGHGLQSLTSVNGYRQLGGKRRLTPQDTPPPIRCVSSGVSVPVSSQILHSRKQGRICRQRRFAFPLGGGSEKDRGGTNPGNLDMNDQ